MTAAATLTWDQAVGWRLRRQHLADRQPRKRLPDVVHDLCGLHAQVMSSAELTAWARVDDLRRTDVRDALWERRELVKLWAMRGTLHLVTAADYPTWVGALGTYAHFRRDAWLKYFGLTAKQMDKLLAAVAVALDGDACTREELAARVRSRTRSKAMGELVMGSWGSMLKPASYEGRLCFAPSSGTRVNFVSPEAWLGSFDRVDGAEAQRRVTRWYLATYGPAPREDYARWWSGYSPAQAERQCKALGDEVAQVDVEGTKAWMLAEHVEAAAELPPVSSVRLVPAFDQYVVTAYRNNPRVLDPGLRERVYRKAAWLSPVLLVGGRMAGVWRHEQKAKRVVVSIEPFGALPAKVRKLAAGEAERLAAFLGAPLQLDFGAISRA